MITPSARGATALAHALLDAAAAIVAAQEDPFEELRRLGAEHQSARPTRAVVGFVSSAIADLADLGESAGRSPASRQALLDAFSIYRAYIKSAQDATSRAASDTICEASSIVTICRSSTVIAAAQRSRRPHGRLEEVLVLETRPTLEGWSTARELSEGGLSVTLGVDAAVHHLLGRSQAAVCGADSITSDGVLVNRVGSLNLALAARHAGVPLVVAAPSYVFVERRASEMPRDLRAADDVLGPVNESDLGSSGRRFRLINPADDFVPGELVSVVASDVGTGTISDIRLAACKTQRAVRRRAAGLLQTSTR